MSPEVRRFLAANPWRGVVAVSGGADSVALLRALGACGADVVVAHVNHQLRGAESDGDAAFVRDLCASLGVECRVKSLDVAALAAGDNLEAVARRVRYGCFAEVASDVRAGWVATAHTADDQAETVLHRIIRGTGLQGLRGIAAERASVVRPLLSVTRAEVLAYLAEIGQAYRTDSTNADTKFTRNRIRHELLPLLKTFNPDVVSALAHLAEHASEAHEMIASAAADLLTKAECPRPANAVVLDGATLRAAPPAVLRAALRLIWEREGWPMADMGFDAWDRAVAVARRDLGACDFPGGVSMRHAGAVVQLARRS
ncbi:MAG: tRNA lysidine(34) synthetase TilS [Gemmataceae bacterium]|nr:tRNA lysidine(34) synthetase TilS [Gemmataceae bacterium]